MVRGTLPEVWDRSVHSPGGSERFGNPSGRSGTGRGFLPGGLGRVGGPSGRSGTCQGTLREVRNRSGDHRGGPGRFAGRSERSGKGRGTLVEVRD